MTENWRRNANCKGAAWAVFFHPDGERGPERKAREDSAKRWCHGCPVKVDCLDEAFTAPQAYGTWGEMTERERRSITDRRTLNPLVYWQLRTAGMQPAAAAARASGSAGTEVAASA